MSGTGQWAIVGTGLCCRFGELVVFDDIDLTVDRGTIFALLGPNGEGKTTMAGSVHPGHVHAGQVRAEPRRPGAPRRFGRGLALSCHGYSLKDSTPHSTIG